MAFFSLFSGPVTFLQKGVIVGVRNFAYSEWSNLYLNSNNNMMQCLGGTIITKKQTNHKKPYCKRKAGGTKFRPSITILSCLSGASMDSVDRTEKYVFLFLSRNQALSQEILVLLVCAPRKFELFHSPTVHSPQVPDPQ
jgi:hypothetical protein